MSTLLTPPESIRLYLDEIAGRLWEGHAAVLVGAGFSKNTTSLTGSSEMPSWKGLAEVLYRRLYPQGDACPHEADALGLADEYTAIFGTAALDALLRDVVDDNNYAPSKLHSRLIELPWSEVFTTNYDTLLERAAETVISRKYDVVTRVDDLPFSRRPRIVKLHGSMPKCAPFIISGEQYRRYPLDYAPFVNTVQQAIMENLFCLIGFSAHDPNFEQWTGWVRDHLGDSMPYVYLIGLLNLTESKKQALMHKKIIPVDLSLVQGISDHQLALSFFLDHLEHGRPKAPEEWTSRTSLPLPPGTGSSQEILDVVGVWRKQRESYPGWTIAPASQRQTIWHNTDHWIPHLLRANILPPNDLLTAFELDWRMRKSLVHPIPEVLEWIEKIVRRYNPFPEQLPDLKPEHTPVNQGESCFPWLALRDCWVELVFTLAKGYRLGLVRKQHDYWMRSILIDDILSQSPEWVAKWYHERCMYHIADLDVDALRNTVDAWPTMGELPFQEIRKGAFLIESGEYARAERTIRDALNELRRRTNLKPITYELINLSQESLALLALQLIEKDPYPDDDVGLDGRESERRRILRQHECDPLHELISIGQSLASTTPDCAEDVKYKVTFDGHLHYSRRMVCGFPDELHHALEFSNFFEEGGLPFRGRCFSLANEDIVQRAAGILASEMSPWALAILARSGHVKALDELFSRTSVARMKQEDVDSTLARYIAILTASIKELPPDREILVDGTLLTKLCPVLSEVISRLVIRSSGSMQERAFDIAARLWSAQDDAIFFVFHDSVRNVFHRLLGSAGTDQVLRWMPRLLSLPLSDQPHDLVTRYKGEPLLSTEWPDDYRLPATFDRSSWTNPISYLLSLVESGSDHQREIATIRLSKLHGIGALYPQDEQRLQNALWNQDRVDRTTGLPLHTGHYDCGLLRLPHPEDIDLHSRIKRKLLDGKFPLQTGKSVSLTQGDIPFVEELLGVTPGLMLYEHPDKGYIKWTADEVFQIFDKIIEWWDSDKGQLSKADHTLFSIRNEFSARFAHIPTLLTHIVLPRLSADAPEQTKEHVSRLLSELSDNGIPCLRARVAALTVFPLGDRDLSRTVAEALASSRLLPVTDACVAVATWNMLAARHQIVQPPEEVTRSLCDIIYFRHLPALRPALSEVRVLVKDDLLEGLQDRVLVGLEYLIEDTSLDGENTTIKLEDRPEYRRRAAALSYALCTYYQRHGLEVPRAIERWGRIAQDDPLPEVRKEWGGGRDQPSTGNSPLN